MPTVNSNIAAKYALNNLNKTDRDLTSAMERLSSGKRINHAGDDAAGAAISDRMTSQIKGLEQSARNAADVISMAQVTEGALDETSSILQRIRMLAIQSATDSYNAEERSYLNAEVIQLLAEHDRVTRDTTFNEIAVLDGTFADRRFQIGTHEREFATLSISSMRLDALGSFKVRTQATDTDADNNLALNALATDTVSNANLIQKETFTIHGLLGSKTLTTAEGSNIRDIATLVNNSFESTGVSAIASTQLKIEAKALKSPSATASSFIGSQSVSFTIQGKNSTATSVSAQVTLATDKTNSNLSALRDSINNYTTTTGITATLSADKSNVILVQNEGFDIKLGDVNFDGDTSSTGPRRTLIVTSLDNDEAVAGNAAQATVFLGDTNSTTEDADGVVASATGSANTAMTLNSSGAASADSATNIAASQSIADASFNGTKSLTLADSSAILNSFIKVTSAAAGPDVTIEGTDVFGNTQTETLTNFSGGTSKTTTKVFATVTAVKPASNDADMAPSVGTVPTIANQNALITITGISGNDNSAVKFDIVGTDMDGNAQTETITGPAGGTGTLTVTGRKIFKEIHSVTPKTGTTGAVTVGLIGADSVIVSGQLEMFASNSFTVLGENNKSLFESSPGAATLDKLEAVNVKTRKASINALRVIDRALDRVHKERAKLGALMSRMEKAIDNLTNVAVNTEASRGRIRDANFAKESSSLTKAQILQQSALAMIAQAGRIQQNVLTLLQS